MGHAPSMAAPAVKRIGRNRWMPLSRIASRSGPPSVRRWRMKSIRMIELRTTIPASAIIPIIAVAVNHTGSAWPPTSCDARRLSSQKPVKMSEINHAFRGPDVMFAYFQGGLIADFVTKEWGFEAIQKMLRRRR